MVEMLLAVAIILVLGAIAFPAIFAAQENMRLVELDNAAKQIANVAQTQMTAKKADGTWLPLVEYDTDGDIHKKGDPRFPEAKNKPADFSADTYYMTSDEARANGIVPSLSLDDTVRDGDYLIEFTASTANVVGVFFTDGKTGLFGTPHNDLSRLESFYDNPAARLQAVRRKASPMVGYYQGTPSSATPAVALANPAIWLSDEGRLCVQDPNLNGKAPDGTNLSTATAVTITKKNEPGTGFVLGGLDATAQSFTVSTLGDDPKSVGFLSADAAAVFKLVSRSEGAAEQANVYSIDLNELSRIVQASESAKKIHLDETFASFSANDEIRTDVEIASTAPSIPATATAYMPWPGKVAKLTLLITNPALGSENNKNHSTAEHIEGTYIAPKAELVATNGDAPVTNIKINKQEETFAVEANQIISEENIEATRQSYSGGWVRLSEAYKQQANVKATVGSYLSPAGVKHQYQIYELWINGQRAGYLKQNVWKWEDTDVATKFRECVIGLDDGAVTSAISTITINTEKLYNTIATNTDEGYEVYIRTTPKLDEVHEYFSANADTIARYLTWEGNQQGTTSARGQNRAAPVRKPFENEFGASSTVGTWTVTTRTGASVTTTEGGYPAAGALRVYYSATPAVAWSPDGNYSGSSIYTALPNAVLWLYERSSGQTLQQPEAFVFDSRSGANANFSLSKSGSADFEIPYTRDYLFYRVIEYCDEAGKRLQGYGLQYVPHSVMDDPRYAEIAAEPPVDNLVAAGWSVQGQSTWPENENVTISPDQFGKTVGTFNGVLAYGYVQLNARYAEKSIGFMYLEFDENDAVTGYYGSFDGKTVEDGLAPDNKLDTWGYYVVVPEGSPAPVYSEGWWEYGLGFQKTVLINGQSYDLYRDSLWDEAWTKELPVISGRYRCGSSYVKCWFNLNFAGAVALTDNEAYAWGDSPESAYRVRHYTQFISQLGLSNFSTELFGASYFKQTHDIDMAKAVPAQEFVFRGEYDGNGFAITNYSVFAATNGATPGLFYQVKGESWDAAALKNVRLVDVLHDRGTNMNWGSSAGLLAGTIAHAEVTNCTVEGAPHEAGSYISLSGQQWGKYEIGALVGSASDTTFSDCGVTNVDMYFQVNLYETQGTAMGGLVGSASNCEFSACTVSDISYNSIITADYRALYVGGMVGQWHSDNGSYHLSKCLVSSVVFEDQNIDDEKGFVAGRFIGSANRKVPVEGSSAAENVKLICVAGEFPIDRNIGNR